VCVHQDMIAAVRQKPVFSFECGVDQSKGEAGAQTAADRNYSMYVIDLHAMELEGAA
jgi:hypothetical protein